MRTAPTVRVLIASALEPPLVERIRAVDPRLDVVYRADLIGSPRYPADHTAPVTRTPAQAAEWAALVAEAEVMLDVVRSSDRDLARQAPRLRWVQLSSSGVGQIVEHMGLGDRPIVVTNAAGLHATPLAEFVLFAMLYFAKRMPRVLVDQRRHHWERFALDTLPGKTLGIVGLGHVGRAIARLARSVGLRVVAVRRTLPFGGNERLMRGLLASERVGRYSESIPGFNPRIPPGLAILRLRNATGPATHPKRPAQ